MHHLYKKIFHNSWKYRKKYSSYYLKMLIKILIISLHYKVLDWQNEGHAFQFKNLPKVYKWATFFWFSYCTKRQQFRFGRLTSFSKLVAERLILTFRLNTGDLQNHLRLRIWETYTLDHENLGCYDFGSRFGKNNLLLKFSQKNCKKIFVNFRRISDWILGIIKTNIQS